MSGGTGHQPVTRTDEEPRPWWWIAYTSPRKATGGLWAGLVLALAGLVQMLVVLDAGDPILWVGAVQLVSGSFIFGATAATRAAIRRRSGEGPTM